MNRIFPGIPNVAFDRLVREFAFVHEKPVFTLRDTYATFLVYIEIAVKNN